MKGMASEVLSRDTLTSPGKLNDLVEATTPYVALDEDFGAGTMVGLGTEGGGPSVVYIDWDELEEVQERFKNDDPADYQPDPR